MMHNRWIACVKVFSHFLSGESLLELRLVSKKTLDAISTSISRRVIAYYIAARWLTYQPSRLMPLCISIGMVTLPLLPERKMRELLESRIQKLPNSEQSRWKEWLAKFGYPCHPGCGDRIKCKGCDIDLPIVETLTFSGYLNKQQVLQPRITSFYLWALDVDQDVCEFKICQECAVYGSSGFEKVSNALTAAITSDLDENIVPTSDSEEEDDDDDDDVSLECDEDFGDNEHERIQKILASVGINFQTL